MLENFVNLTTAKDIKLKELYRTIRRARSIDISGLKEKTGYKHGTIVRLLDELVENNLVDDSEVGVSSGGRKPKVYKINKDLYYLIGAEINHLFAKVVLLDLELNVKGLIRLRIDEYSEPEMVMDFMSMAIDEMCKREKIPKSKILGIGVGVLASINRGKNSIDNDEVFEGLGWQNYNIAYNLEKRIKMRVMVDSAVNLAALGEYRAKYCNDYDRLIFVSGDVLIRSATILNGGLLYKTSEEIDSFGHTVIDLDGEECKCGSFGCLECYSSLPIVFKKLIRKIKMGEYSSLIEHVDSTDELNYFHMIGGIEEKDELCLKISNEAATYFGIGLSNLILNLHPQVVVIGGTLGLRMYDKAKKIVEDRIKNKIIKENVVIHQADQQFNTVSQGAGCLILDTVVEEKIYI